MKPELLAPAGSLEAVKVAIMSGADAVYCSGIKFGARSGIANLTVDEIIEASEFVHLYQKRLYITVNTLVFENELGEVIKFIDDIALFVDGLIIQDYGIMHYVRTNYPDLEVHISTQCNIHNVDDVKFLKRLGISRIVLARETPLNEIKKIVDTKMPVEVFIHGALCFAYSGNCYLSYYNGKRSGNRGNCAQPCRKEYALYEDNRLLTKGNILSMKDLNTSEYLNELLDLGIASFKIEGRARNLEYLMTSVKFYRTIIDNYEKWGKVIIDEKLLNDLKIAYMRESTIGYSLGEKIKDITTKKQVNHLGKYIGKIISIKPHQATIKLVSPLNINDGIRIISKDKESGFIITRMFENGKMVKSAFNTVTIDTKQSVNVNDQVYLTSSSILTNQVKLLNTDNLDKWHLDLYIDINENSQSIKTKINDVLITASSSEKLTEVALNEEVMTKQFLKTNKLPIIYDNVYLNNPNHLFMNLPLINQLRNDFINKLTNYLQMKKDTIDKPYPLIFTLHQSKVNPYKKISISDDIKADLILNRVSRINYGPLKQEDYAEHLAQIGENSVISPYFRVCNSFAISFFRNFTNSVIVLSFESELENSRLLSEFDTWLAIPTEFKNPMMLAHHCVVAGYYQTDNNCGKCKKHRYYIKDDNKTYELRFNNCEMEIVDINITKLDSDPKLASFISK